MIESPYFPYAFALLIAVPFLIYTRQFVYSYIRFKKQELNFLTVKGQSEQRIQAYERITLFLERIKPANLVAKFDENLAVNCKNTILHLLHKTYDNLSNESTLQDYKTVFLMNYMNEQDHISTCIEDLRKENLIIN